MITCENLKWCWRILRSYGLLFTFVLVSINAQAAEAPRFEAGLGQCKYGAEGNGIWYVEQYPHTLDMTAGCGQLGVSRIERRFGRTGIGWRFAYVDLGVAHVDAVFPMRDEEHYLPVMSGAGCDSVSLFGCLGNGMATQRARGLSLGIIAEHPIGPVNVGLDGGVFVYEGVFKVDIDAHPPGSWPAPAWAHGIEWKGWRGTPYIGLTAQWAVLQISVRSYYAVHAREPGCAYCTGVASRSAQQAIVGITLPF